MIFQEKNRKKHKQVLGDIYIIPGKTPQKAFTHTPGAIAENVWNDCSLVLAVTWGVLAHQFQLSRNRQPSKSPPASKPFSPNTQTAQMYRMACNTPQKTMIHTAVGMR